MTLSDFYNTAALKGFMAPTRVVAGVGCGELAVGLLPREGERLLVVDAQFAAHPLVERLEAVHTHIVSGEPNGDDVCAAAAAAGRPAAIVALGGGSTIDTAKAILAHLVSGDYRSPESNTLASRPFLLALPTTAGTGSEAGRYYVVTDPATRRKESFRSWGVCPDVALLDPTFLLGSPAQLVVLSAFDAFTHLWETYVCRYECSPLTDLLARDGIRTILEALADGPAACTHDLERLAALQQAALYGGLALANVRAGLLHTAGEALSAQVPLAHPETMIVFLEHVLTGYREQVRDREALLGGPSLDELVAFWQRLFLETGVQDRIAAHLAAVDPVALVEAILRDHVLVTKEHPAPLGREQVEALVERALDGSGKQVGAASAGELVRSA